MKFFTFVILGLLIAGCSAQVINSEKDDMAIMNEMPCHRMPDGTMMGDCDGETAPIKTVERDFGETFATDVSSLARRVDQATVELEDGDRFDMTAQIIVASIAGKDQKMLAYNGSIPGPLIKVKQYSSITINLTKNRCP